MRLNTKLRGRYLDWRFNKSPFYKKYPYKGNTKLAQADGRGIFDFTLGFYYNRIPKAANSTVMGCLAEKKYDRKFDSESEVKKLFTLHPHKLSNKEINMTGDLFKFTFVRSPYTRVLSAYLDKILNEKRLRDVLGSDDSFTAFLTYLENGGLYKNAHWAPQTDILLFPLKDFDLIGKVESLDKELPLVLKKIFGDDNLPEFKSYNTHSTNATTKIKDYYSDKDLLIVNKLYENDFLELDYKMLTRVDDIGETF